MISPTAARTLLSAVATAATPSTAAPKRSSVPAGVKDALAVADSVLGIATKAAGALGSASGTASAGRKASTAAGYAKPPAAASAKKKPATAKKSPPASGALAFLKDPKLSIEEKLVRLLSYLNDKWEKDMQEKMDEIAGGQKPAAKTSSSPAAKSKKKSGLLGAVADVAKVAKKFFPQVGIAVDALSSPAVRAVVAKIGGPVLAAAASALGFPALAPALLRYGPAVVDVAAGVASELVDQGAASSASGSSAGGKGGADAAAMSDRQMQVKLMEVQRLMDQQKEMFSLVSNILRSGHDTRMAVIQNVR